MGLRYWQSMSTLEASTLAQQDAVVVLLVSAIEQHGPHLPLSTDHDIGMGLLEEAAGRLPSDFPLWVLPPQSVGSSMEHTGYAGTLSLEPELFIAVVRSLGEAVARCGVRRLVIHNSHGGNRSAIDLAALHLRRSCGMLVVKANYFRLPPPSELALPAAELRHGIHGGALETAMMLHLQPDAVRMDQATTAISLGQTLERDLRRLGPGGEASFAWLAEDLNASGVVGDALLANPAMGERLVQHYGAGLADVIRDAAAFPLAALDSPR